MFCNVCMHRGAVADANRPQKPECRNCEVFRVAVCDAMEQKTGSLLPTRPTVDKLGEYSGAEELRSKIELLSAVDRNAIQQDSDRVILALNDAMRLYGNVLVEKDGYWIITTSTVDGTRYRITVPVAESFEARSVTTAQDALVRNAQDALNKALYLALGLSTGLIEPDPNGKDVIMLPPDGTVEEVK